MATMRSLSDLVIYAGCESRPKDFALGLIKAYHNDTLMASMDFILEIGFLCVHWL